MTIKEEKAKVGRPKLADSELIKDSWCRITACFSVALVMTVCTVGILTARTPLQVLVFHNPNKIQASVANNDIKIVRTKSLGYERVIPAKEAEKRMIDAKGNVTRLIPADPVKVININ